MLDDPVMEKIFAAKLERLKPIIYISAIFYLLLLICIAFLVDRTINKNQGDTVILVLHILVVIYAGLRILQTSYLWVERVWWVYSRWGLSASGC